MFIENSVNLVVRITRIIPDQCLSNRAGHQYFNSSANAISKTTYFVTDKLFYEVLDRGTCLSHLFFVFVVSFF